MYSIGFIGGGQMCEAILCGLLKANLTSESKVSIIEPNIDRKNQLIKRFPKITFGFKETPQVVFISVKPQHIKEALTDLSVEKSKSIFVSIVAAVSLKDLSQLLPAETAIVRTMPNTPAMIQQSATAFCMNPQAAKYKEVISKLLGAIGPVAIEVQEGLLDGVTGLSGSGPAYVFTFIEALADAGVQQGLSRQVSLMLAAQTVIGAGKMVFELEKHPGVLRDSVTSPGGTTINAVASLEENGFRNAVMKAVKASSDRSKELSKM
jgi:pyrroline-5-carboxylate reductase